MFIKPTYEELEQRVIDKMNYNRETIAGHGDKLPATPWLIYMLIGVAGLIVIGILGYGFYTGDRMNKVYTPLVDAAMEIKLEASTAHLWFEEIISGDRYEDMATVWKHLDQANWYAKAMLEGGKNPEGTFISLDDNKMRQAIIEVQGKLSEFRDITKQRIAAKETSGVGTAIDQRYDAIFNDFIIQADEVESRLQQVMARDNGRFRYTQVTLMVICLLLFLSIGIVFHRFERIMANDFWAIKEAKKNLGMEIVKRKRVEEKLLRINRALKMLSECNQAVVRDREEPHLLHEICRIIVDIGGYHLAWVGFAERDEAKTVQPVAQAGYEEGYLDTLNITWADTERGRGPTGTAIRTGKLIVVKDILTDPNYTPWRAEASKRGYEAAIALPLISNGQAFGTLNIYAKEPDAFDAEEIKLLMELADDLVYGIMALRTLSERKQAEEELSKHRDHLEELVEDRTNELKEKTGKIEASRKALTYLVEDVNKAREELEKANEKLKELDRLKSMFIASMSHELRTPLNSIIGFTGIILQGMTGEINPEQKDQLQRVYGSAKHLLNLITDIIDISKIEAGKVEVYAKKVNLNRVIKEAVSTLKPEIYNKGLGLEISLPPDLQLTTDRKRLLQCILNFLSNAVKFTEKGKIRITAQEVGEMLEIRVKDTGIGIKEEDIPKLFKSFVRLDTPLKTVIPGTGLGLYLARKIATEMLGGEVSVESKYGEGSTFVLRVAKEI